MSYTKSELLSARIQVFVNPFIAFAGIEFLPWWISTPLTFLLALLWMGSIYMFAEAHKNET